VAAAGRRLLPGATGRTATTGHDGATGHVRAAARPGRRDDPIVPRHLPAAVPAFAGRRDQLARLSEVLSQPGGTAVISAIGGTAGVGKTALAVQWAHQVAPEFPDGQLFVNLRGFGPSEAPVTPADAVRGFLDALGVPADRLPETVQAQLGLYRSLLAGKRMLVVLDNARDAAQVRPLLPGSPTCRVVVTSRNQLTGLTAIEAARPLPLDVLADAEARELLERRLGTPRLAAEAAAVNQIIAACARLPLALCIIAARAAMRPDLPLAHIAAELAAQPGLAAFAADEDPAADIRAVFSWSYRQLDDESARAFRLCGLHPGPDLERYAVAALAGTSVSRAGRLLDLLARGGLIQPAGPGRYGQHDLLRGYARELAAADEPERRRALGRLFDYYLYTASAAMDVAFPAERHRRPRIPVPVPAPPVPALGTPAEARAWLDAERAGLAAASLPMAEHDRPDRATRLSDILFRYLDVSCHYPEAAVIHGHARRAARRLGDRAAEIRALTNLGTVAIRQRRYEEAVGYLSEPAALGPDAADPLTAGRTLSNLGFVEFLIGRCASAIGHLEAALALSRGRGDRTGEAHDLATLGFFHLRQGRYELAADQLGAALALFRAASDRGGEVHAIGLLADVDLRVGALAEAAARFGQALALCRELGDRSNEADLLAGLGLTRLRQGRRREAAAHLTEALAASRAAGDRSAEASVLNGLGELLLATGRPADARARYAAALEVAVAVSEKYEQARAHEGLARADEARPGSRPVARPASGHWRAALDLYGELGAPEADQVRERLAATAR
jgi:tetratricopeptide (TPR) repeat protein